MDYIKYCKLNRIRENDPYSKKMYYFYKEAETASTDIKKDDMYVTTANAFNNFVSFAPFPSNPQVDCTVPCDKAWKEPNKKEKTMYVDNDKHIESSKINYLLDRASTTLYVQNDKLPKVFGFQDDKAPETAADFVKRITDGKFIFKDESKKDAQGYYYRPYEGIRWRDPAVKEDKAGLDAAKASLQALYQDTKDTIAIGTPAEGLAAVKALDAWTPTVGTA